MEQLKGHIIRKYSSQAGQYYRFKLQVNVEESNHYAD